MREPLLRSAWASATSYALVLSPVATAIVSALLTDEHLSLYTAAGGALVMIGAWLGAFSSSRGRHGVRTEAIRQEVRPS